MGLSNGSVVKNPSVMQELQETQVRSLGQEDPLEKEMANHSSILAWRIPWTEEPGRLQPMGLQRDTTEQLPLNGSRIDSISFNKQKGTQGIV